MKGLVDVEHSRTSDSAVSPWISVKFEMLVLMTIRMHQDEFNEN